MNGTQESENARGLGLLVRGGRWAGASNCARREGCCAAGQQPKCRFAGVGRLTGRLSVSHCVSLGANFEFVPACCRGRPDGPECANTIT